MENHEMRAVVMY